MRTAVADMALVAIKWRDAMPHAVLMVREGVRQMELTPVNVGVHRIMSEPELRALRRPRLLSRETSGRRQDPL